MDHTLIIMIVMFLETFCVEEDWPVRYMCMVDKFLMDYNNGCLNNDEFMKFQLMEFKGV